MGDLKGIEVTDMLGLSQPLTKLIETIAKGVGKVYEPMHIRRMAKAKAEEIRQIGDAISEQGMLPISYEHGAVDIDATNADMLAQRIQMRVSHQERKKQQNIDAVVAIAACELESEEAVSDIPVDEDWITRLFNIIEGVSSNEMRLVWGKILAGEIKTPGSFSLRTLDVVRNLNKKDAEAFQTLIPLVLRGGSCCFVGTDNNLLQKHGSSYATVLALDDCGLINSGGMTQFSWEVSSSISTVFYNSTTVCRIVGKTEAITKISLSMYPLTRAGQELYSTLDCAEKDDYLFDVAETIQAKNNARVTVTVHKLQKATEELVYYEKNPFRTF